MNRTAAIPSTTTQGAPLGTPVVGPPPKLGPEVPRGLAPTIALGAHQQLNISMPVFNGRNLADIVKWNQNIRPASGIPKFNGKNLADIVRYETPIDTTWAAFRRWLARGKG